MMSRKLMMLVPVFLVGAMLGRAQSAAPKAEPNPKEEAAPGFAASAPKVAVIIPVKNLTGDAFERLSQLLKAFGAEFKADSQLRVILVYAPKEVADQMRRVVEELDRPGSLAAAGRNLEIALQLVRCGTGAANSEMPLPPDLEPVAKQLRATMGCKSVELWENIPVRLQEGMSHQARFRLYSKPQGIEEKLGAFPSVELTMWVEAVVNRPDGRYVRLRELLATFTIPLIREHEDGRNRLERYERYNLRTAAELKEGQRTVLGKVGLDNGSSVFLVLTPKVVDELATQPPRK